MNDDVSRELIVPQQEFNILKALKDSASPVRIDDVASKLGTDVNSLMRSIAELENLGLVRVNKTVKRILELTEEGKKYLENGLPEVRLARVLINCGCKLPLMMYPILQGDMAFC
ncbi:hypothetical protein [Vulcanisaeta distributa]|uniref:hypothetical protein n=1 Tax=Vulcanisaeta distributa TaxID=164451 RepID=UPI000B1B8CF0|nr:hypothetical protein [Vulcanisaeta distributa]